MARIKFAKSVKSLCNFIMRVGRFIGARRVLFIWSAAAFAIALFFAATTGIDAYNVGGIDMNVLALTKFFETLFAFLKLFVPVFILVVATKYIFDCGNKPAAKASATLRLSFAAAVFIGLTAGAIYYMNAGHIIGANPSAECAADAICMFSWGMAGIAGRAFLTSGAIVLLTVLALRGIYTELSFMLSKRK